MLDEREYRLLKPAVRRATGLDLDHSRPRQMRRRIGGYICRTSTAGPRAFATGLGADTHAAARLRRYLAIGHSEFFADAGSWDALRERVLPGLLSERPSLRVWSAGCSHGAEAYGVAMLLAEIAPGGQHRVLGTDIEPMLVERARAGGPYTGEEVRGVSPERLSRWFRPADGGYRVRGELPEGVSFRVHDLLEAPIGPRFDLVMCRNVAIFLSDTGRVRLAGFLARALRPGGYLVVGAREAWPAAGLFRLEPARGACYRRTGVLC